MTKEEKPEFHEPYDEAFACLRLELYRPYLENDSSTSAAWKMIKDTRRALGQSLQRGFGDLVIHVRNLRADGKTRFATPADKLQAKTAGALPPECYTDEDLKPIAGMINNALKTCGASEYVYASVARRVMQSELAGDKLKNLLRGEAAYPVMNNVGVMMRSRNWQLRTVPRIANGKEYVDVEIETGALQPGAGKVRLVCRSLHGGRLARAKSLLKALEEIGIATEANGWSKGALTIMPVRRPGQPEKWFILIPYSSPRVQNKTGNIPPVLAVHRGVVNMLTAATDDEEAEVFQFPGRDIVGLKSQMHARRKQVARDISVSPHTGRGNRYHYKALARMADKEARATQTHLWRAARWVQNIAERVGARLVLLDDFTSFDPDRPGPPFEPYVRTFPLADLKGKVVDALTRRAGIPVQEVKSRYISQKCPKCGCVSPDNVEKLPTVKGADTTPGYFRCTGIKCKFKGELDGVSAMNLLVDNGFGGSDDGAVEAEKTV